MKNFLLFIWEIIKIVVVALLIVIPIRYFIFQPFLVHGQSMEPNFGQNDYLFIDQISYRFRDPQRGEVIVFRYPQNPFHRYIKRIIGLPGETIEIKNGQIIISKQGFSPQILNENDYLPSNLTTPGRIKTQLNKDEYFVLGDNRNFSSDSRHWGSLKREYIIGRTFFRAWPFTEFTKIKAPIY